MSKIIDALDNYNSSNSVGSEATSRVRLAPLQFGENNHLEHKWSNEIKEKIIQLSFQLVRSNETAMKNVFEEFEKLLVSIIDIKIVDPEKYNLYVSIVLRLICQTRDIVAGKGEYALAYGLLFHLYTYLPDKAMQILEKFVNLSDTEKPYGSWKDIKYFVHYCKQNGSNSQHQMIQQCIELINQQLKKDIKLEKDADISLCAKWVPREGSKYAWFFRLLAKDYFKDHVFMNSAKKDESKIKAQQKCYMEYRKILVGLNRKIDTVQIKQCRNSWADIDHNKTTSVTISRNKNAFLNVTKSNEQRSELPDRIICAENFKSYIEQRIKCGKEVKGQNVGLNHFTKQALDIGRNKNVQTEIDLLNSQWRSNSELNLGLGKMIAMVDTSGSMCGEPIEVAIALGIRVAEKSILGKRVLTFSANPKWHNLEENPDFFSMVQNLKSAEWNMNTNFYAALELILNSMVENNIPPEESEGLVLAVFSDMQIDEADRNFKSGTMYENIQKRYQQFGYHCPHILFWNLSYSSGFPCLSEQKGASMISGFSPILLNLFCEKGIEAIETITPWNLLIESLNHKRYSDFA
jgi:hypothetical protein